MAVLSPPSVTYVQQQQQQPVILQQQQQPIFVQQQQQPIVVQQQRPVLVQQQQPIVVQQQQQQAPIVVQQQRPVLVQQQPVLVQQQPVVVQQQRPVVVQQQQPVFVQQQQPVLVQQQPVVVRQQRPIIVQQQAPVYAQQQQQQSSYDSYQPSYQQPAYQPAFQPSYEPAYQTVIQQPAQPVLQPVIQTAVLQQVQPVFDPVYRPAAATQVFRVPFKAQKGNKAKAKGKEGKGRDKFKSKGKGPSNTYDAPSNSYGAPPSYNYQPSAPPAADPPAQDEPAFDSLVEVLQPQLDIQYQYKYSGPPIMGRGEKASKKLKKLFYKGAILLGGLGAITAAPIVPGVIGGRKKRETRQRDDILLANLTPSTEMMQDSYIPNPKMKLDLLTVEKVIAHSDNNSSLFDNLPFQGAPIPKKLRKELARYLPPAETINDTECLQKSFCENLIELNDSPFQDSFLFFYAA